MNPKYEDIFMFINCSKCAQNLPHGMSASQYVSVEVGISQEGQIIIWCKRHDQLVAAFTLKDPPELKCSHPDCQCGGQ